MDDVRVGRIFRALRKRRGWSQRELAICVGLSQQTISLIERGHGGKLSGATLQRVFAALDARWEGTVSWRGGAVDRLLDEGHARLVAAAVERLRRRGWDIAVEVTYSEYGERGSIDVLGCRRDMSLMLVVEVKSDLVSLEATVRKLDEKARIVRRTVGRQRFGFQPAFVARVLALPATDAARRRVRRWSGLLTIAFPHESREVRRWLRNPDGDLSGILFLADTHGSGESRGRGQ